MIDRLFRKLHSAYSESEMQYVQFIYSPKSGWCSIALAGKEEHQGDVESTLEYLVKRRPQPYPPEVKRRGKKSEPTGDESGDGVVRMDT